MEVDYIGMTVNDATPFKSFLERNDGGSINFDCKIMIPLDLKIKIKRSQLKDSIEQLFSNDADIALFYFSGHGYNLNHWRIHHCIRLKERG